jgi:uncharacterized protein (UPF0332 family)
MEVARILDLAERLIAAVKGRTGLGIDSGAAECRSAVSRAYYAAFHVAREYLEEIGFALTMSGAGHKALQFALKASGHGAITSIGAQLDTLYTERLSADYDLHVPRTEALAHAETVVAQARLVLRLVAVARSGKTSPPIDREAVADAISKKKLPESWGKLVTKR